MKKLINKIMGFTGQLADNHAGAYAAQSAYFFMLSMIPIILLLLTIVQYTPVTKGDVMSAVVQVFPEESMKGFMVGIVNQVYNQSRTVIPITAVIAMWSAGKGVLAMSNGLNCVYGIRETRNYIFIRIRASIYTVIFIVSIVLGLVLSVFGNSIRYRHAVVFELCNEFSKSGKPLVFVGGGCGGDSLLVFDEKVKDLLVLLLNTEYRRSRIANQERFL